MNTDTTNPVRLAMTTVDCADPKPLGEFYSRLLGWEITYQDDNAVMLSGGDGPALGFGRVDEYTPPPWPDPHGAKAFHLDLSVADIPAAERRAVELGATVPDFQPGGDRWRVLLDPAGRPFCLATWPE
ncbi:hypothetical protein LX16_2158 [Stackebrandtia albiflava]|uniref:VOC domain-containing protein n=1 Tax=Stackebrandtia albiflava TaxID=406432 RepID=A0A562V0V5_9ACTN|nr:VOC family protein [Stackebrandtia albiflava]TWJ11437.1 hypothetical protein LX16_2158 [Stackebrandtia albiflava]